LHGFCIYTVTFPPELPPLIFPPQYRRNHKTYYFVDYQYVSFLSYTTARHYFRKPNPPKKTTMSKKGTNKLLRLLFLWLGGVLICSQLTAQDLQVLLDDTRDCNQNTYCLSIQLKATSVPKQIGTSSIFLQYNPTALAYATYMSSHFDGSDQCIQGQATAWDVQTFDATSAPGYFNLTMTLLTNQFSCPAIEGELIEVGVLCFDVIEEQQSADIKILANNTSFNSHLPNTGEKLHPTGKMGYSDTPKTLKCTGAAVDCSQLKELWEETTIEIPITSCVFLSIAIG